MKVKDLIKLYTKEESLKKDSKFKKHKLSLLLAVIAIIISLNVTSYVLIEVEPESLWIVRLMTFSSNFINDAYEIFSP